MARSGVSSGVPDSSCRTGIAAINPGFLLGYRSLVSLLGCLGVFLAVTMGQAAESSEPAPAVGRRMMIEKFDKDGDGRLDESERQVARSAIQAEAGNHAQRQTGGSQPLSDTARREQLVLRYDSNGDGLVDENERVAARDAILAERRNRAEATSGNEVRSKFSRQQMIVEFDADGDGALSVSERRAAMAEMRTRLSAEPKGPVQTPDEAEEPRRRRATLVQQYDLDADGRLDEHERRNMRETLQERAGSSRAPVSIPELED